MQTKIHHASALIIEDHLKQVLCRTKDEPFKVYNNKNLPRAQHSAFGDFPKDYMPSKKTTVQPIKPLDNQELSSAVSGTGKFTNPTGFAVSVPLTCSQLCP